MRYKEERKREFRQKHKEHSDTMSLGVNMPQMTQTEMRKVKVGLADVFKTEINPIMGEVIPRTDDREECQVFEGPYEEALHLLHLHIVNTLRRLETKMYCFKKVNPRIQKVRGERREELFAKQDIQRRLLKLKSKLEQFEEYQEESPAARRKQVKIVAQLDQCVKLISPETRGEIFRVKNNEEIWEELKPTKKHWTRLID
jgi:hypothetical protein